uniref:Kunitz-type protease inhibitor n=1 Tax=Amblyomma americanum TaxID=6943 RepID=B5M707_AMBAM
MNVQDILLVLASVCFMLGTAKCRVLTHNESENKAAKSAEGNVTATNSTSETRKGCTWSEECCDREPDCPKTKFVRPIFAFNPSTGLCSYYRLEQGCPPTKNNFSTLQDCIEKCEEKSPKTQDSPEKNSD